MSVDLSLLQRQSKAYHSSWALWRASARYNSQAVHGQEPVSGAFHSMQLGLRRAFRSIQLTGSQTHLKTPTTRQ